MWAVMQIKWCQYSAKDSIQYLHGGNKDKTSTMTNMRQISSVFMCIHHLAAVLGGLILTQY